MVDTMRAWQHKSAQGGLENNLFLPASGAPKPSISDDQILVEVYSAAINPADYKVPELGFISKIKIPSPATPGMDFCGKVAKTGNKVDSFQIGELVFGTMVGVFGYGTLGQYIVVSKDMLASMPDGLKVDDMASVGIVGLTAYQAIQPHVKEGSKVFVNGGSGGVGIFAIQIAKTLGCHVTTTCSAANIDLCKSLGADEVLNYKSVDIITALKEKGQIYDLVVDNVGTPDNLYKVSHEFILPHGIFVQVGTSSIGVGPVLQVASNLLLPGFLGGGKRRYQSLMLKNRAEELAQIGRWMKEGKIRAILDSVYEFDDAPKAFEKLKTGRAKGKIVVHVKKD